MAEATREMTSVLAAPERRVLRALAERIPPAIGSDHLTVLGVLGALGTAAGYALSRADPDWLWLASAMLVVNWFGDSLDGTLARVRKAERPRYGFYLDHAVDAFTTTAIGLGIGLSPYVSLWLALGLVVVYLMLSINVYLESYVLGVFRMAYGIVGPTEVRLILILGNSILWAASGPAGGVPRPLGLIANAIAALLGLGMLALLVGRFAGNLRNLARLEPARAPEASTAAGPEA